MTRRPLQRAIRDDSPGRPKAGAQRRIEARVGELLGEAVPGRHLSSDHDQRIRTLDSRIKDDFRHETQEPKTGLLDETARWLCRFCWARSHDRPA